MSANCGAVALMNADSIFSLSSMILSTLLYLIKHIIQSQTGLNGCPSNCAVHFYQHWIFPPHCFCFCFNPVAESNQPHDIEDLFTALSVQTTWPWDSYIYYIIGRLQLSELTASILHNYLNCFPSPEWIREVLYHVVLFFFPPPLLLPVF